MRTVEELKGLMEKVNDYWIDQNPDVGDCAWDFRTKRNEVRE